MFAVEGERCRCRFQASGVGSSVGCGFKRLDGSVCVFFSGTDRDRCEELMKEIQEEFVLNRFLLAQQSLVKVRSRLTPEEYSRLDKEVADEFKLDARDAGLAESAMLDFLTPYFNAVAVFSENQLAEVYFGLQFL